jgi:hypothetical protein
VVNLPMLVGKNMVAKQQKVENEHFAEKHVIDVLKIKYLFSNLNKINISFNSFISL